MRSRRQAAVCRDEGGEASEDELSRPILMFDSGIGGLTVLREARVLMPDRRFVYVADDAAFPYGDWEETALRARIIELFGGLLGTLSARNRRHPLQHRLDAGHRRTCAQAYPETPFVGTVPAIKPAAERTRSGLVSVLATPGTVKRPIHARPDHRTGRRNAMCGWSAATQLARLAETYMRDGFVDEEAVRAEIAPCFIEQDGKRTDIVVLACTHYPFLVNRMRKTAPWPVDWLDPAEAIARRALSLLDDKRRSRRQGRGAASGTMSRSSPPARPISPRAG